MIIFYSIWIIAILFSLYLIVDVIRDNENFKSIGSKIWFSFTAIFIVGFVTVVVIFICTTILTLSTNKVWINAYSEKVINAQDNNLYVISRYSTNNEERFYYKVELSDGAIVARNVPANNSRIYEIDDKNYRVEIQKYTINPDSSKTKALKKIYDSGYWFINDPGVYDNYYYTFYVPKGSVKRDFNFDSK